MRKINTSDVFKLARILKKGNIEKNIAEAIGDVDIQDANNITEKVGIKVMLALFESCGAPEVEAMVYDLFAGIAEVEAETIGQQPFEDTIAMIKEISEKNNLANFFKQAGQLM